MVFEIQNIHIIVKEFDKILPTRFIYFRFDSKEWIEKKIMFNDSTEYFTLHELIILIFTKFNIEKELDNPTLKYNNLIKCIKGETTLLDLVLQ